MKIKINLLGYVAIAMVLIFLYALIAWILGLPMWPATILLVIMIVITIIRLVRG